MKSLSATRRRRVSWFLHKLARVVVAADRYSSLPVCTYEQWDIQFGPLSYGSFWNDYKVARDMGAPLFCVDKTLYTMLFGISAVRPSDGRHYKLCGRVANTWYTMTCTGAKPVKGYLEVTYAWEKN